MWIIIDKKQKDIKPLFLTVPFENIGEEKGNPLPSRMRQRKKKGKVGVWRHNDNGLEFHKHFQRNLTYTKPQTPKDHAEVEMFNNLMKLSTIYPTCTKF